MTEETEYVPKRFTLNLSDTDITFTLPITDSRSPSSSKSFCQQRDFNSPLSHRALRRLRLLVVCEVIYPDLNGFEHTARGRAPSWLTRFQWSTSLEYWISLHSWSLSFSSANVFNLPSHGCFRSCGLAIACSILTLEVFGPRFLGKTSTTLDPQSGNITFCLCFSSSLPDALLWFWTYGYRLRPLLRRAIPGSVGDMGDMH